MDQNTRIIRLTCLQCAIQMLQKETYQTYSEAVEAMTTTAEQLETWVNRK